jgi:hypothetical protein
MFFKIKYRFCKVVAFSLAVVLISFVFQPAEVFAGENTANNLDAVSPQAVDPQPQQLPNAGESEVNPYLIENINTLTDIMCSVNTSSDEDNLLAYYVFGQGTTKTDAEVYLKLNNNLNLANLFNSTDGSWNRPLLCGKHSDQLYGWQPIGWDGVHPGWQHPFKSHFDGSNYTISGLKFYENADNYAGAGIGFFGVIEDLENQSNTPSVKNLRLVYDDISNIRGGDGLDQMDGGTGGLAGMAKNAYIYNCHVSGANEQSVITNIAHPRAIGGLIGLLADSSRVENSSASLKINLQMEKDTIFMNIGGLVGRLNQSASKSAFVISSFSQADITIANWFLGEYNIGGLIGSVYLSVMLENVFIQNSYATGNIIYTGGRAGGLIGLTAADSGFHLTKIENSYATGNVVLNSDQGSPALNAASGGLVGKSQVSVIENSYATGNVVADELFFDPDISMMDFGFGGLVGIDTTWGTYDNCYARGNVIVNSREVAYSKNIYIGGIVGYASSGVTISNCYFMGYIDSNEVIYVGGIVGYSKGSLYSPTKIVSSAVFSQYIDEGWVSDWSGRIYGAIRDYSSNIIADNYALSTMGNDHSDVCGKTFPLGSYVPDGASGKNGADITPDDIKANFYGTINWDSAYWQTSSNYFPILKNMPPAANQALNLPDFIIYSLEQLMTEGFFKFGEGTDSDKYLIENARQLAELACLVNLKFNNSYYADQNYIVTQNIDLTNWGPYTLGDGSVIEQNWKSVYTKWGDDQGFIINSTEAGWIPIGLDRWGLVTESSGQFRGQFWGENHIIDHLTIDLTKRSGSDELAGLFGYVGGYQPAENLAPKTIISGVFLENVNIASNKGAGTLAAVINSTYLSNNYSSGIIRASYDQSDDAYNASGGLVGFAENKSLVENCFSAVNVENGAKDNTWVSSRTGGLVGAAEDTQIANSYAKGDVKGGDFTGGLVGSLKGGNNDYSFTELIKDSYATGNVTGKLAVGGLVGDLYDETYNSNKNLYYINHAYATGYVQGSQFIGGIIGRYTENSPSSTQSNALVANTLALNVGLKNIDSSVADPKIHRIIGAIYSTTNFNDSLFLNNWAFDQMGQDFQDICGSYYIVGAVPKEAYSLDGYDVTQNQLINNDWFANMGFLPNLGWNTGQGLLAILYNLPNESIQSQILPAWLSGIKFFQGSGIQNSPYIIESPYKLAQLACLVNNNLSADIYNNKNVFYKLSDSLNGESFDLGQLYLDSSANLVSWQPPSPDEMFATNRGWVPIGNLTYPFKANFDGNNRAIEHLIIQDADSSSTYFHNGLFGFIQGTIDTSSTNIENVLISNSSLSLASGTAGFLAGQGSDYVNIINSGIINSKIENSVSSPAANLTIGGIIGQSLHFKISNCLTYQLQISGDFLNVGGIIGESEDSSIENSFVKNADIKGRGLDQTSGAGGFVGASDGITAANSYFSGNIAFAGAVGGAVGLESGEDTVIEYVYIAGQLAGNLGNFPSHVSGIAGVSQKIKIDNSVVLNDIIKLGDAQTGELTRITNSSSDSKILTNNFALSVLGINSEFICGQNGLSGQANFDEGRTHDGINGADVLASDITASGQNWFAGDHDNFKAWNNSIWNMADSLLPILDNMPSWSGNFQDSAVPDYFLTSSYFQGNGQDRPYEIKTARDLAVLACLVNIGNTSYNNSGVNFQLSPDGDIDLLNWGPYVSGDGSPAEQNYQSVYGSGSSIGIGGWVSIGIQNYPFLANFRGPDDYAQAHQIIYLSQNRTGSGIGLSNTMGGLFGFVGRNDKSRVSISNIGLRGVFIETAAGAGGLVGHAVNADFDKVYVSGITAPVVHGCYNILICQAEPERGATGGLIGWAQNIKIFRSFTSLPVISDYENVGGLVGNAAGSVEINNCYSTGKGLLALTQTGEIKGSSNVGGLVGNLLDSGIRQSYSTSDVHATADDNPNVGGLIGIASGNMSGGDLDQVQMKSSVSLAGMVASPNSSTNPNIHRLIGALINEGPREGNYAYENLGTQEENVCGIYTITGSFAGDKLHTNLNGGDAVKSDLLNSGYNWFNVWHEGFSYYPSWVWNVNSSESFGKLPILLELPSNPDQIVDFDNYVARSTYFTGIGDLAQPYQITNADELSQLACLVNRGDENYNSESVYYILTNDLDLTNKGGNLSSWIDPSGAAQTNGWMPIGKSEDAPFRANFNGNKKTISNLSTSSSSPNKYFGLFGVINQFSYTTDKTVENLGIKNANISGQQYLGVLAGYIKSAKIKNIWLEGKINLSISDTVYAGGIAGAIYSSYIYDSYFSGDITGQTNNAYVGGIVGLETTNSDIKRVYSDGFISLNSSNSSSYITVGGIAGQAADYSGISNSVVLDNYLKIISNSKNVYFNRIVGQFIMDEIDLKQYFITGNFANIRMGQTMENICGQTNLTVGEFADISKIHNDINGENVLPEDLENPNTNWFGQDHPNFQKWSNTVWSLENGQKPILLGFGPDSQNSVYPEYLSFPDVFQGTGQAASPYLINSDIELVRLACLTTSDVLSYSSYAGENVNYKVMENIDLGSFKSYPVNDTSSSTYLLWNLIYNMKPSSLADTHGGWMPIGSKTYPFLASFDGNSKIISNIIINRSSVTNQTSTSDLSGLFGYVGKSDLLSRATFSNIYIEQANIKGLRGAGGLVGYASKTNILNSYVTGTIQGCAYGACTTDGLEINEQFLQGAGGLASRIDGQTDLIQSFSKAIVKGHSNVGGLVGSTAGGAVIDKSYYYNAPNNSDISVSGTGVSVGGLVGRMFNTSLMDDIVRYSYATGNISGRDRVGGLVGSVAGNATVRVIGSVALTKLLIITQTTPANSGRIVGYLSGTAQALLQNNFAWNSMGANVAETCNFEYIDGQFTSNLGHNTVNGENITYEDLINTNWFGASHTNWEAWNFNIWNMQVNLMPVLQSIISSQTNQIPAYLQDSPPFEGKGTQDNQYLLKSSYDLALLGCLVNSGFEQINNSGIFYKVPNSTTSIDLTNWGPWDESLDTTTQSMNNWKSLYAENSDELDDSRSGWIPIGNSTHPFRANINGNQKSFNHLTINRQAAVPKTVVGDGLLGIVENNSSSDIGLLNIALDNVSIHTMLPTGALAASTLGDLQGNFGINIYKVYARGVVESCRTGALCNITDAVGGLVGMTSQTNLDQVYADVSVAGKYYVGGLVGWFISAKRNNIIYNITNSYALGDVTSETTAGGLAGFVTGLSELDSPTVANNYATGDVVVTGNTTNYAGGLVGTAQNANISNNVALNDEIKTSLNTGKRIIASVNNVVLKNNWAFTGMGTNSSNLCGDEIITGTFSGNKRHDDVNGADLQVSDLMESNWFGQEHNYWISWADEQNPVWILASGKIPVLVNTPQPSSQDIEYPVYIGSRPYFYGDGTRTTPFLISSPQDLAELACVVNNDIEQYNNRGVYYAMTNDISLAVYGNEWVDPSGHRVTGGWQPIGIGDPSAYDTSSDYSFKANFDGQNYIVSDLTISRTDAQFNALFGVGYGQAEQNRTYIKNLGLDNLNIGGSGVYYGSLIGYAVYMDISHIWVDGDISVTVNATEHMGGIMGRGIRGSLTNSSFVGNIRNNNLSTLDHELAMGGIIGAVDAYNIDKVYAEGTIIGTATFLGGLIGLSNNNWSHIYDSVSLMSEINSNGLYVGRIVGGRSAMYLGHNWAISTAGTSAQNICGGIHVEGKFTTDNTHDGSNGEDLLYSDLTNSAYNWFTRAKDNWTAWSADDGWIIHNAKLPILQEASSPAKQNNTPMPSLNVQPYFAGLGTIDNSYQITNSRDLAELACLVNSDIESYNLPTTYYKVINNIDLQNWGPYHHDSVNPSISEQNWRGLYNIPNSESSLNFTNSGWVPIGNQSHPFQANFDGQGATISNLSTNNQEFAVPEYNSALGGFFGYAGYNTQPTSIKNIKLNNINIINSQSTASGLVVYGQNLQLDLVSVSNDDVLSGGVSSCVGQCVSDVSTGGIIGQLDNGLITNSYSNILLNGSGITGGIVGLATDTNIQRAYSNSIVFDSKQTSGGIVGVLKVKNNSSSAINNSYFGGYTQSVLYSGSIAGSVSPEANKSVLIDKTYAANSSNTIGQDSDQSAGGIVGFANLQPSGSALTISNSVSLNSQIGAVQGENAHRILGSSQGAVTLQNNFGWVQVLVNNSIVDSADSSLTGFEGLTVNTTEILSDTTFWAAIPGTGPNFDISIWHIQPNTSAKWLPILGGFGPPSVPPPADLNINISPTTTGSQNGAVPIYLREANNYYSVTFKPGAAQGDESISMLPEGELSWIDPLVDKRYVAPAGSSFAGWCVEGTDCSNLWLANTVYTLEASTTFIAQWVMQDPQDVYINYANEAIGGLSTSIQYFFSKTDLTSAEFEQNCLTRQTGWVSGSISVLLSLFSLPTAESSTLYYVRCGVTGYNSLSVLPSNSASIEIPARRAAPIQDVDYTTNVARYETQFTTFVPTRTLAWAEAPQNKSCDGSLVYNYVEQGVPIKLEKKGNLCLVKPYSASDFVSFTKLETVIQGTEPLMANITPYIETIIGKKSGELAVSREGSGTTLHVIGDNLNNQGSKTGQIIIANRSFGSNKNNPYLFNVSPNGKEADIMFPSSVDARVNLGGSAGNSAELILPTEEFGESVPYLFSYVENLNLSNITPKNISAQGGSVAISGSFFEFGNMPNVSSVQVCEMSGAICKMTNWTIVDSNQIVIDAPAFPVGTQSYIIIANSAGTGFDSRLSKPNPLILSYVNTGVFSRIYVPNIKVPAGSKTPLPVTGLDQTGASIGDFGYALTQFEGQGVGFMELGARGNQSVLAVSEKEGVYNMSLSVDYLGQTFTTTFSVTIEPPVTQTAFITPGNARLVGQTDSSTQFRAFAVNSLGEEINITNQIPVWRVSGGGQLRIDQTKNLVELEAANQTGNFKVYASSLNYEGRPLVLEASFSLLNVMTGYVDNVVVYPVLDPNPKPDPRVKEFNSVQVNWNIINSASVTGYTVDLYNTLDGKVATKTVPSGEIGWRFDNLFSGAFYAVITPNLGSISADSVRSAVAEVAHYYLPNSFANIIFTDISRDNADLSKAVYWLASHGITTGYSGGIYKPNSATTREQMAAFFHRFSGFPAYGNKEADFVDQAKISPNLKDDVLWLSSLGLVSGYPCTAKGKPDASCTKKGQQVYRPKINVNRIQMALFMYKFANSPVLSTDEINNLLSVLKDTSKLSNIEQRTAVAFLIKWGITTGYEDGTYKPNNNVTRAQMAQFLNRLGAKLQVSN